MSHFTLAAEPLPNGQQITLFADGTPLTQETYLDHLADDATFADWYTEQLCSAGGEAVFWEHPAMCTATADSPTEFVLLDAPALVDVAAEGAPFAQHFAGSNGSVCAFDSLGGDARLIAPVPHAQRAAYAHLMAFLRTAPAGQCRALWSATGRAVRAMLSARAVYLSTSGLGVYWLHVRLDRRPKYYQHRAYRVAAR